MCGVCGVWCDGPKKWRFEKWGFKGWGFEGWAFGQTAFGQTAFARIGVLCVLAMCVCFKILGVFKIVCVSVVLCCVVLCCVVLCCVCVLCCVVLCCVVLCCVVLCCGCGCVVLCCGCVVGVCRCVLLAYLKMCGFYTILNFGQFWADPHFFQLLESIFLAEEEAHNLDFLPHPKFWPFLGPPLKDVLEFSKFWAGFVATISFHCLLCLPLCLPLVSCFGLFFVSHVVLVLAWLPLLDSLRLHKTINTEQSRKQRKQNTEEN